MCGFRKKYPYSFQEGLFEIPRGSRVSKLKGKHELILDEVGGGGGSTNQNYTLYRGVDICFLEQHDDM